MCFFAAELRLTGRRELLSPRGGGTGEMRRAEGGKSAGSSTASATAAGARPRCRAGSAPPRLVSSLPCSTLPFPSVRRCGRSPQAVLTPVWERAPAEKGAAAPAPSSPPGRAAWEGAAAREVLCPRGAAPWVAVERAARGQRKAGREGRARGGARREAGQRAPPPARGGLPVPYTDALAAAPRRRCGPHPVNPVRRRLRTTPENVALKV